MSSKIYTKLHSYITSGLVTIFFMGFASGFPLALTASVLSLRLKESGISISSIGLFSLVSIPYSVKYIWAPLLDSLKIRYLQKLGRRRGWLIVIQVLLIASLFLFGAVDPKNQIYLCTIIAICITFLSATQDIVIDAYRIERLPVNLQAVGSAFTIYGYRVGLFVAGVAPLFVAEIISWSAAYYSAAIIMLIGVITTLVSKEPDIEKITSQEKPPKNLENFLMKNFILPFKDLIKIEGIAYIIAFIILFKLGDAMAGVMTMPFLSDKGFTKPEIIAIVKTFGTIATFVGLFIGGLLSYKISIKYSLLIAGILQMISNLLFIYQDYAGHNQIALIITIIGENISSGIGVTVLVAYLSSLCNVRFAATHYALFSSFTGLSRSVLSSMSGFIVDYSSWSIFFLISTIAAIPALFLLPKIKFFTKHRTDKSNT
ncbi:MAG: AmpG family muropeptide MFS transporter [Rickettsiales bacterium]|nr:AmpG family muropeptide MFS transporter [Rickettsiales bacterium]